MLAPPKRKRHSSPPAPGSPEIPSPLNVVNKRRRRSDFVDPFWSEPPLSKGNHSYEHDECYGESSSAQWYRQAGVERRRTKQWERLNAPSQSSLPSTNSQPCPSFPSTSQPDPYRQPSSPMPRSHSQPDLTNSSRLQMSSSPIRHRPPSSSPFRSSSETKVEEWIDPEEMSREWGEEYASQNSLLHNLVSLEQMMVDR